MTKYAVNPEHQGSGVGRDGGSAVRRPRRQHPQVGRGEERAEGGGRVAQGQLRGRARPKRPARQVGILLKGEIGINAILHYINISKINIIWQIVCIRCIVKVYASSPVTHDRVSKYAPPLLKTTKRMEALCNLLFPAGTKHCQVP